MREDDAIRVRHMLDAAREALEFAQGRTRKAFDEDRMLVLSISKDIEIIGEAASRVTECGRNEMDGIPWEEIIAMRHRLVHAYFDINLDISGKPFVRTFPD